MLRDCLPVAQTPSVSVTGSTQYCVLSCQVWGERRGVQWEPGDGGRRAAGRRGRSNRSPSLTLSLSGYLYFSPSFSLTLPPSLSPSPSLSPFLLLSPPLLLSHPLSFSLTHLSFSLTLSASLSPSLLLSLTHSHTHTHLSLPLSFLLPFSFLRSCLSLSFMTSSWVCVWSGFKKKG